ncbi:hypothetical protein [Nitrospira sp. Kam-Ns4a]
MPYLFPHEGLFAVGVGALIVALLVARVALARRGARPPERRDEPEA